VRFLFFNLAPLVHPAFHYILPDAHGAFSPIFG